MQCNKCGYEPSLKEIQAGGDCPGCAAAEQKYQRRLQEIAAQPASQKPQEVVVVDFRMPFMAMVWFMVKWAFAAIPALIIVFLAVIALMSFFGGLFSGFVR
jgi:hypothetical protein